MTKQEHIDYWVKTSEKDWKAVMDLFKSKNYLQSLFWAHLVIEKLVKAHWVKDNEGNIPPKIHNIVYLADKTKLTISEDDKNFFNIINQFQLEGRYPDYLEGMFKKYKLLQTKLMLDKINIQRKCLLKKLQ